MWPWEHVFFGYLLVSLYANLWWGTSPSDRAAVVVAIAAVLPDLIDKPLAWQFGVFPSGYALGHSVFFATFLSAVALFLANYYDAPKLGIVFTIGYFSHLLGDVIPHYVRTGEVYVGHLLWPVVVDESTTHTTFTDGVGHHLVPYVAQIASLELTPYLTMSLLIAGATLALWIHDGAPGARPLLDWAWRRLFAR